MAGSIVAPVIDRLLDIEVSALSDADKSLPLIGREIRPLLPGLKMAGPAFTVVADGDLLPVVTGIGEAQPGDVLVVDTRGTELAIMGEIFTTGAHRRGLAGIVVDGYVRDMAGIRRVGMPVYARGLWPAAVPGVARTPLQQDVIVGGVEVRPGDIVFGDDDGLIVGAPDRVEAALGAAEEIIRAERAVLRRMQDGEQLHGLTNHAEHIARLDAGEESRLLLDG
jgi:regulator of RNase E activity RraA